MSYYVVENLKKASDGTKKHPVLPEMNNLFPKKENKSLTSIIGFHFIHPCGW